MMNRVAKTGNLLCAALCTAMLLMYAAPAWGAEPTTLDDLQAAYHGESNAHAKYLIYAKKADEEGYRKVAALFRAAAKSEEIHASTHAKVIRQMGAMPRKNIMAPYMGTTEQNLRGALMGETQEANVMYPQFIARAEKEKNKAAVRTFTFSKEVAAHMVKLLTQARDALDTWRAGGEAFYICGECGTTVEKVDFTKCPVCGEPKSRYSKVE